MERVHEFAIKLPGEGTYGNTIGRWPAFDLEAKGDSEAQVYQELVGRLQERTAGLRTLRGLRARVRHTAVR